jgi:hypothetical protein
MLQGSRSWGKERGQILCNSEYGHVVFSVSLNAFYPNHFDMQNVNSNMNVWFNFNRKYRHMDVPEVEVPDVHSKVC